jgi:hypothetical protein
MLLPIFVGAASGYGRLLLNADLNGQYLNFTAGDFDSHGVLLIDADGSPCATGLGGDAGTGQFRASFEVPERGYYRIDAHSAGQACGGGSEVDIMIDWCRTHTCSGSYTQGKGWVPLWAGGFLPGHPGGITTKGGIDAFRVVRVSATDTCYPPFGSLSVDTDAITMPPNMTSLFQGVEGLGHALTASFRPQAFRARRLKAGEVNQVVIDFDMTEVLAPWSHFRTHWSKSDFLLEKLVPDEEQLKMAAKKVCDILDTVECGNVVSFKLEKTAEVVSHNVTHSVVVVNDEMPEAAVAVVTSTTKTADVKDPEEASNTRTMAKGGGDLGMQMIPGIVAVLGLLVVAGATLKVLRTAHQRKQPEAKDVEEAGREEGVVAKEEKKPEVEDDNASTVTPVSLASSSLEDMPAEEMFRV